MTDKREWHNEHGDFEGLSDTEIAERIAKVRAANKRAAQADEADYRRTKVEGANEIDEWQERVKAHNELEAGLGDALDDAHHGGRPKKKHGRGKL